MEDSTGTGNRGRVGRVPLRYRGVLLDMFDTLVDFDRTLLPRVMLRGQPVRTTSPHVHAVLKRLCSHISLEEFAEAFLASFRAVEARRDLAHREVSAHERFRLLFASLDIPDGPEAEELMEAGIAEHMRQISRAVIFPESHGAILQALSGRYRLGVVSNFDHTAAVMNMLSAHGIQDRLEAVLVSEAVGWRKPHPEIFRQALDRLGLGASEVIFVGDTPESDILGARQAGMDVIWINRDGRALPPGIPPPTHTVARFTDILPLLR
jgi:putative hydrolase of the HAD superfamily